MGVVARAAERIGTGGPPIGRQRPLGLLAVRPWQTACEMSFSREKKLKWFDQGSESLVRFGGQIYETLGRPEPATYVCPICVRPFLRTSVDTGELTVEHVPPAAFGGRELVLTCKTCNNDGGSRLDAHARRMEDVADAMNGRLDRTQKVRIAVGDLVVNGRFCSREGTVTIPESINRPGAPALLRGIVHQGEEISLEYSGDSFAELGAKISWLRSGYLLLFAVFGYPVVADPALDMVRRQILEPDNALSRTFSIDLPGPPLWSERRLAKIIEPASRAGWMVQIGPVGTLLPLCGDMSFYERISKLAGSATGPMRCEAYAWPTEPLFGLDFPTQ